MCYVLYESYVLYIYSLTQFYRQVLLLLVFPKLASSRNPEILYFTQQWWKNKNNRAGRDGSKETLAARSEDQNSVPITHIGLVIIT